MIREAWVVVDLGFGDAGKGATVDFLVRDRGARLVVRWNGGAQAGHTVVLPGGRAHTFAQLGAGSFVAGVRTHLGPAFVLHPGGLRVEAARLASVGVPDALERTTIDRRAPVITPFQQAAGRLRELLRGSAAHGTCGVGVGEAVADALAGEPDALCAGDLADPGRLAARLRAQQARKRRELAAAAALADPRGASEWALLTDEEAPERVLAAWAPLAGRLRVVDPGEASALLAAAEVVVCEGAQGVLLDQSFGFHPHTTWSDCTPAGALALLAEAGAARERVRVLGVLRAYATRHGPGPFPTHDPAHDRALPEPHNDEAGWQGAFRRGPLDLVLLRYALEAAGDVDGLALTHLDRVADPAPLASGYQADEQPPGLIEAETGVVRRLIARPDRAHTERLGAWLAGARPLLEAVPRERLPEHLAERLGIPVWLEARGPTAAARRWRVRPGGAGRGRSPRR